MSKETSAAPTVRSRIRRIAELADYNQQTLFDILD
jgi:hypothetical protein